MEQMAAIRALTMNALSDILDASLCKASMPDTKKTLLLDLIVYMLDTLKEASTDGRRVSVPCRIPPLLVCSLARGARKAVETSLVNASVNETLMEAAFRCLLCLGNLIGTLSEDGFSEITPHIMHDVPSSSTDRANELVCRDYMLRLLIWLKVLAKAILGDGGVGLEDMTVQRRMLCQLSDDRQAQSFQINWPDHWSRMLIVERMLFPSSASSKVVRNVYALPRPRNPENMVEWEPSHQIRQAAELVLQQTKKLDAA